jgi:hypothetical protein
MAYRAQTDILNPLGHKPDSKSALISGGSKDTSRVV